MGGDAQRCTWQYLFVRVVHAGEDLKVAEIWAKDEVPRFNGTFLHRTAQTLGAEGWELAGVDPHGYEETIGRASWYVFKRPEY